MTWRKVAAWLGVPAGRPAGTRPRRAPSAADRRVRDLAVWALSSIALSPRRWAGGSLGVVAMAAVSAPGAYRLGLIAVAPLVWRRALMILTRSDHRSLILTDVSSRVKRHELARRLKAVWNAETHRYGLARAGRHPRLYDVTVTANGVEAVADLRPVGGTVDELARHAGHLQSALGGPPRLSITGRALFGTARIRVLTVDPLASPVTPADLPASRRRNAVVTGITDDGAPVHRDLLLPQLVVGAQGAGKSSEAWVFIRQLQASGVPYRLRVFDPKGQEFAALRDAAYVYESNPAKWPEFVSQMLGGLQKRQKEFAAAGVTEVTRFTERNPLDVTIVDEILVAATLSKHDAKIGGVSIKADDATKLFLSQGRAAGYTMLALSQLGQTDVIGRIRGLFAYATCLRVGALESALVDVMLGADAHKLYPAHRMPPGRATAGIGYTRDELGRVVRYRAAFLDRADRAAIRDQLARDTARWGGRRRAGGAK